MAEGKLLKYRVVVAASPEEFQEKLNLLSEEGYIIHDFHVTSFIDQPPDFYAVMKLGENDYSDVIQIKDVAPELATEAIANGLEPVSMSLSTKFIRMVRRKPL